MAIPYAVSTRSSTIDSDVSRSRDVAFNRSDSTPGSVNFGLTPYGCNPPGPVASQRTPLRAASANLYRSQGAVEREFGRLKHEWARLPLRVRGLERVRLHAAI